MKRLLVCLILLASACRASQWSRDFPNELKSRYFDFYYTRNAWDAKSFAHFADCFIDIVNRDFFPAKFDYPITVLVLPDQASFQAYLIKTFGIDDPPRFGIYLPRHRLFATYETSGLGTFAHEIMHPLVSHNLSSCPEWAEEGIPAFFEKFYGYYDGDSMVVQWGYQNPWRLKALGRDLTHVDLKHYVTAVAGSLEGYQESQERLISVFLWQQGKFVRMLQLIAAHSHKGYPTYFEAAMGMRLKEIEPLWQAYLNDVRARLVDLMQLPPADIEPNRQSFERFMMLYGLPVQPAPKRAPTTEKAPASPANHS